MSSMRTDRLLVLDVERFRIQFENLLRRQQRITLLGVIVVEELESGVLHRFGYDIILV